MLLVQQVRTQLGLVEPRGRAKFGAVLKPKDVPMQHAEGWHSWAWLPDTAVVLAVFVFTDGSAVIEAKQGGLAITAGWGVVCVLPRCSYQEESVAQVCWVPLAGPW